MIFGGLYIAQHHGMLKRTACLWMISIALLLGSLSVRALEVPVDTLQHLNESFPLLQLPLEEPPINAPRSQLQSPEAQRRWTEMKMQILRDSLGRVSSEFAIPYSPSASTITTTYQSPFASYP